MESSVYFYLDSNDSNDNFTSSSALKILLLGYGKSSKAVIEYYKNKPVIIHVLRVDNKKEYNKFLHDLPLYDICFRSPGIAINRPIYTLCNLLSKQFTNELIFALKKCKSKHKIVVTGSNGKTSLCTLIFEVLSIYRKTHLHGNIGSTLIDKLDDIFEDEFLVIEASSFQLENLDTDVEIGIIKNYLPNHLNATFSRATYFASKKRLEMYSKYFVDENKNVYIKNNYIYVKNKKYLNINDLKQNDDSFIQNIKIVINILLYYKLDINLVKDIFKNFSNLKYRNEVKKTDKYTFVNDGKSTSSSATKYCFSQYKNKRILILGGIHKSNPFSLDIKENDEIFIYGKDRYKIEKEVGKSKVFLTLSDVLNNIKLKENCTVIFSPGCSSLDQYDSYVSRSKEFESWVNKWIE